MKLTKDTIIEGVIYKEGTEMKISESLTSAQQIVNDLVVNKVYEYDIRQSMTVDIEEAIYNTTNWEDLVELIQKVFPQDFDEVAKLILMWIYE